MTCFDFYASVVSKLFLGHFNLSHLIVPMKIARPRAVPSASVAVSMHGGGYEYHRIFCFPFRENVLRVLCSSLALLLHHYHDLPEEAVHNSWGPLILSFFWGTLLFLCQRGGSRQITMVPYKSASFLSQNRRRREGQHTFSYNCRTAVFLAASVAISTMYSGAALSFGVRSR